MSPSESTNDALQHKTIVEQAQGALSVRLGVSLDTALRMMDGAARNQRRHIDEVAAEVLANGGRFCHPARRSFGRRRIA